MNGHSFKMLRYLLALAFLCGPEINYCQVINAGITADSLEKSGLQKSDTTETGRFEKLEKAIGSKVALQQTQQQFRALKQRAVQSHDDITLAFAAIKQLPGLITLQQRGIESRGAVTWYYFALPANLDTLNKTAHISKHFYSFDKNKGWIPVTESSQLKTGDKIRVTLTIETVSRLKFVHISDPRAAAFEPADNNSGYEYNNGLSYYQSVKDTGLEIFIESVPRGISEINYEMIVAMEGQFAADRQDCNACISRRLQPIVPPK